MPRGDGEPKPVKIGSEACPKCNSAKVLNQGPGGLKCANCGEVLPIHRLNELLGTDSCGEPGDQ
jgi:hypothetical protein